MSDPKAKRIPRFGPELWEVRGGHEWSLWDLWFCVVAVRDHDSDLDGLARLLVDAIRKPISGNSGASEAKLSHLHDLAARLDAAAMSPTDLADADALADKAISKRAREKVTGRVSLEHRARTPAMLDTPRRRLARRARYGHWSTFPSNPAPFFEKFQPTVDRKDFVSKGKTFSIASRLEKRLAALDGPRRSLSDRLALYRAFHTAGLEIADAADDSYGAIGETRTEAWGTYLDIDWRSTAMDPADYWRDLCELRVWEPYGLGFGNEISWFRSATADDVPVVESILLGLEAEHRVAILDHHAEEALESLADLYVATQSRDRFTNAAHRLGSRSWRPIEAMARSQLEAGDRAGAIAVFRAADQPGWHQDHLHKRCLELTGIDLAATGEPGS